MTTIDQLDISIYNLYAIRTRMMEQFSTQIRIAEDHTIPPQTQMVNILPKLTELDILLGVIPVVTPWAYFFPPQRYRFIRRSPFAFHRVAPSLGSLDQHVHDEAKIAQVECHTAEEKQEKETILNCLSQIDKINEWIGFIIGRVGQFLQG